MADLVSVQTDCSADAEALQAEDGHLPCRHVRTMVAAAHLRRQQGGGTAVTKAK